MATEQIDPTAIIGGDHSSAGIHYADTEDERELVTDIMQRFEEAEQHRKSYDWEIEFNRNLLRGGAIVARDEATNTIVRLNLSDDSRQKRSSADNILRPIAQAFVGKLSRVIPAVEVMPGSDDESDIQGAEVANGFLRYFLRVEAMRAKYVKAKRYLSWAGTVIWQPYWDRNGGRQISWCETCGYTDDEYLVDAPCPLCESRNAQEAMQQGTQAIDQWQQDGEQAIMMGGEAPPQPDMPEPEPAPPMVAANEGAVRARVLDPRDFYPEPGVEDITDMRYAFTRTPQPVSKLRRDFPAMAEHLASEDGIHEDRSLTDEQTLGQGGAVRDYAYLYEVHERPSQRYKHGRLLYLSNGHILNRHQDPETGEEMLGEPNPYHFLSRVPFFAEWFYKMEGVFWGESPITHAWGQYKERNDLLRQMADQRRGAWKPPILAPLGSEISSDDFVDMHPGKVVKYDPMRGGKPEYMPSPDFAPYTYNEVERTEKSVQQKFNVTDHEMGQTTGEESGRFAAILEAQSSESVRPVVVENGVEYLEFHRAVLLIAQHYHSQDFVFTVRGSDKYTTYSWSAMNLAPGWDVTMVEVDSLSQNPAIRMQQCDNLLEKGYFTDPQAGTVDWSRYNRMAGINDTHVGPDMSSGERSYAASIPDLIAADEFSVMEEQGKLGPRPWDDVRIMSEELIKWLRGAGRKASPDLQAKVGQAWMFYVSALQPQTPQQAGMMPNAIQPQKQQQPQGGPGATAGPANEQQGSPATDAAQHVQNADQQAEDMAMGGAKHEG